MVMNILWPNFTSLTLQYVLLPVPNMKDDIMIIPIRHINHGDGHPHTFGFTKKSIIEHCKFNRNILGQGRPTSLQN